jgi:hypothetical protein
MVAMKLLHLVVDTLDCKERGAHALALQIRRSLILAGSNLAVCNKLRRISHLLDSTADMRVSSCIDGHVSMPRTLHFHNRLYLALQRPQKTTTKKRP